MPVSGLVIRLAPHVEPAVARTEIGSIERLELGDSQAGAFAAVLDAPDYRAHDEAMSRLEQHPLVCVVDVVFHDFSDVTSFERPRPRRRKSED